MTRLRIYLALAPLLLTGCLAHRAQYTTINPDALSVAAEFPRQQVTGVAVSKTGRMFVSFPFWGKQPTYAVAEVDPAGQPQPYPNDYWNQWDGKADGGQALGQFVCVQSVYIDDRDHLWILDTGSPRWMSGVIPGGPKLLDVDLATNTIAKTYYFDSHSVEPHSYLNDVRVDNAAGYAYITDSGVGAIVVLNLADRSARRVLENDPSTKSEDVVLHVGGRWWLAPLAIRPKVNSDGLALSPDGQTLYYQALTSHALYAVPTAALRDASLSPQDLAAQVKNLGPSPASDGLVMDAKGNLYHTALEWDAIVRRDPQGQMSILVRDPRLVWPDTFALGPNGEIYFTASQIHLAGPFNWGLRRQLGPYKVLKFQPQDIKGPTLTPEQAAGPGSQ
ncbi:MAG: SMP-30/gluconolactonase/LRE family protein [Phycisphaeraceae bacterium]|nr:SMP-30/gluconolactonase/LRE family protein [Phycisphaeraceae bacterium]